MLCLPVFSAGTIQLEFNPKAQNHSLPFAIFDPLTSGHPALR
jgi:hypothetical protein